MSRTHYRIYKEQTFVLARTLIVKHEEIAAAMNVELYYRGYEVDENPYNWRYYLNLSGEYHQADLDELYERYGYEYITVKVPTDEGPIDVPLTKELLHGRNANKSMMNEYQIGSKFFDELISRYPDFQNLITGILNPIDLDTAITADDGEILFIAGRYKKIEDDRHWFETTWYSTNETLIEPQEDNLIIELQRYINTFLRHWHNSEYVVGNDLYIVTMLGVLYSNIPSKILNIRLGNCKTNRAHSFHVRAYLESHGNLGKYIDFIPTASAMWLYRNIHYLEANSGKQLVFDELVNKMLTPNQIPLSAYTARHELSHMSPDKLLPTGMLYKEVINFDIVGASDDDRTVRDILNDEIPLARDNDKDLDYKESKIQEALDWGGDDRINTKVLESEMMDLGEPYPFTFTNFLFNHWAYCSAKGFYTGSAYATNPVTGDRLSFSSKNAYILAMYCLNKAVANVTLETIPEVAIYDIPMTRVPEEKPSDSKYHLKPDFETVMSWCNTEVTRRRKVLELVGSHVPNFYANDSQEFYSNVQEIYYERIRKYNVYSDVSEIVEHGDLKYAAKSLYWMGFKEKLSDLTYERWFRSVGIDPEQFTTEDLLAIGLDLVASATGVVDEDGVRKKWLQKSLIAIMKHFISYTVHFIEKFADGAVAYLEGQALRYSNFKWTYTEPIEAKYNLGITYTPKTDITQKVRLDVSSLFENTKVSINTQARADLDLSSFDITPDKHTVYLGQYNLSASVMNVEFNMEHAEPVYLTVTDNVVNTIVNSVITGHISDASYRFNMLPDSQTTVVTNITGMSNDAISYVYTKDYLTALTTSISGHVVDEQADDVLRNDSDTLLVTGISAGIVDATVPPIYIIDDIATTVIGISASKADEGVGVNVPSRDKDSLYVQNITAGISDASVTIEFKDTLSAAIDYSSMMVRLTDPELQPVTVNADAMGGLVRDITGEQFDKELDIDHISRDTTFVVGIEIEIDGDTSVATELFDEHTTIVTGITGDAYTTIERRDIGDDMSAVVTDVAIVIDDSERVGGQAVDDMVTNVEDIEIELTDTANTTTVDNATTTVVDITLDTSDIAPEVNTVIDNVATVVTDITMSRHDAYDVASANDATTTIVSDITLGVEDVSIATHPVNDDDTTLVNGITIAMSDTKQVVIENDEDTILVTDITVKATHPVVELGFNDDNTTLVPDTIMETTLNDIEISEHLEDHEASTTVVVDITGDIINHDIYLENIEEHVTQDVDLKGDVIDVPDRYDGVSSHTDVTTVRDITGTLSDGNLSLQVTDDGADTVMDTQITVTDESANSNHNDNGTASVVNITLEINKESEDSNPNP